MGLEGAELQPLPSSSTAPERVAQYAAVQERLQLLLDGECNWVAAMASVACELHHAFQYYHWTVSRLGLGNAGARQSCQQHIAAATPQREGRQAPLRMGLHAYHNAARRANPTFSACLIILV